MATYTDFFVATDEELRRAFPGWGRTLAEPRVITRAVHSLAAGRIALPTRREWDDPADPPRDDAPPPDLGRLEVVQMKSVDQLKLAQLLCGALGETFDAALTECSRPGLIAPPSVAGALELGRLPPRVVDLLAAGAAGEPERSRLSACWEAAVLRDLATIPNASARAFETQRWTGACAGIFSALSPLFPRRRPDQALYVLVTH